MKPSKSRTLGIWMILIGCVVLAIYAQPDEQVNPDEMFSHYEKVEWSKFVNDLEAQKITQLYVYSDIDVLLAFTNEEDYYRTVDLLDTLNDDQQALLDGVEHVTELSASEMTDVAYSDSGSWGDLIKYLLFIVIAVFAFIFFLKKFGGRGMDNILSLRHSKARFYTDYQSVKFSDVGGCEAAKEELADVVDFLNNPDRWVNAGARLPRGILLEGPPGCGKTLLARAVAGESSAKFFLVSASEFVEMFVGVGAARVRDMFEQAAKEAPAIIFIDELDAIGRKRGTGIGSAHDEREQTLNQILVSLDGFEPTDRIVVLAATNRADILDAALVRPGRFDRRLVISVPEKLDRESILKIHLAKLKLHDDVSLEQLASLTDGMTGAQLENLVNDAVMLAVRRVRQENSETVVVCMGDFQSVIQQKKLADRSYNMLDSVLIESASQFAAPAGRAVVKLTLKSAEILAGEVVWMDSAMIKIVSDDGREVIVAKNQITRIPFGWAKPVPVNPSRFNRRVSMPTGMMLTAAAGPVSNLMLALIVGCLLAVLSRFAPTVLIQSRYLNSMLEFLILLNVLLAVFNCLPIYPLDGSRIAEAFVPVKWRAHWVSYVRWCPVLLAGVILLPFLSGISIFEWPINKTLELIDWLSG